MHNTFHRRDFLRGLAALGLAGALDVNLLNAKVLPATAGKLPRWRGFNLLEKFIASVKNEPFREQDFAWMAEWGFNFVRLPMSYRCWSDPKNWKEMKESVLAEIDQAVEFGRRYGIHVCLNFHRAPGYSVDASLKEPFNLWTDAEPLEATVYQWSAFARRYKNVPSSALSFDLINEPGQKFPDSDQLLDDATYARVVKALAEGIHAESPERLIIADGLCWGTLPVPALSKLGVGQSTRGYAPMELTHWKANWVGESDTWPKPTWPLALTPDRAAAARKQFDSYREAFKDNRLVQDMIAQVDPASEWNRGRLSKQLIQPWKALQKMGVGVHVGEFGAHNFTPHDVVLAWMRDLTGLWKEAGWGWALWNFRGDFGILDSGRSDVKYEEFHGHKLDREMLELLRSA